jgi:rod shape-determining protein MreD
MSARRALGLAALVLLAALLQITTIARLPWPGAGGPDVVLLLVAAAALAGGPRVGAVSGFGAGLVLDLAPPADHALGQWAFVCCALGYVAGLAARDARGSLVLPVVIAALTAAAGPPAFTLLGDLVGDPRAALGASVGRVPATLAWSLLLAPLAVPLAGRLVRGPRAAA